MFPRDVSLAELKKVRSLGQGPFQEEGNCTLAFSFFCVKRVCEEFHKNFREKSSENLAKISFFVAFLEQKGWPKLGVEG